MKKKLVIIDSFALIFRAYYAYPPTLTNREGELTNAVYGFSSLLIDVINKFKPTNLIAVFDPQTPLIRQSDHVLYKANRKETDKELVRQIPRVREVLESFNIPVLKVDGYEADDVIGTLVKKHSGKWADTIIVTGDQDLFQLINDDTQIYLAGRKFSQSKLYGADEVKDKLEITPEQVIDYKALCGDASDNIPGVPGVGKKTASKLLNEYQTLKNIYDNIEEIKGSLKNKLSENYEQAKKSQALATIEQNVPLSFNIEESGFETFDLNKVENIFNDLDFKSIIRKLKNLAEDYSQNETPGLFDVINDAGVKSESNLTEVDLKDYKFDDKKIVILANTSNLDKSCVNYSLSSILALVGENKFIRIENSEIKDFFTNLSKKDINIISPNFKNLLHALNNDFDLDLSKSKFVDLGVLTHVLSYGMYSHEISDILKFAISVNLVDDVMNLEHLSKAYDSLSNKIGEEERLRGIFELEQSILPIVYQMEQNGITFDERVLINYQEKLESKKAEVKQSIFDEVGHEFNVNSPKQVGEVLFNEMSLPGAKKTKSGSYSTNERVLKDLRKSQPVVDNILNYREIDKLLSTYIKSLPVYVQPDNKIHANFDQLGAVSGRFSSNNPNMQNIPINTNLNVNVRNAFVAESEKSELISFDYSQQELRILSAISGEQTMINSFNKNIDIHKLTASRLFGLDFDEVSAEQRGVGKTINFSIVYGISSYGLSQRLEISPKEAGVFIKKFYTTYPKIAEFYELQKQVISEKGFAETLFGRRRRNVAFTSSNRFAKQAAERELLNFLIQGSAADIMKFAMRDIDPILKKYKSKLLLQIHDEFVFEYVDSDASKEGFVKEIKEIMETVQDIGVTYKVDYNFGKSWGELK